MANAKPSMVHGDNNHSEIPTAGDLPKAREVIKMLDVSGKVVKLVAEYAVGEVDAKGNQTIRRDYE